MSSMVRWMDPCSWPMSSRCSRQRWQKATSCSRIICGPTRSTGYAKQSTLSVQHSAICLHIRQTSIPSRWRSRSEEHTSELQSPCNLVCRLLLEKKKKNCHLFRCHLNPDVLPCITDVLISKDATVHRLSIDL